METEEHKVNRKQKLFANTNSQYENQAWNEHVNILFNKCFTIVNGKHYPIPKPTTIFKDSLWMIDELQLFKNELNNVKNCLNNYDLDKWQLHTKLRNSAKDVMARLKSEIQPELLTQAWCKFYEIVSSFSLIPVKHIYNNNKCFKSVHLCEAPGAFITSLNHWLKTNTSDIQWDWIAMTLNPYYEGNLSSIMIDDDRFIRHTLSHWCFGEDNTGNLMNLRNLNELIKISEPHDNILLVTADGSINCIDVPAEQENTLIHLHFCETVAALQLLAAGGSFLLKIFTIFECNTVCLIYLLSCCFENVDLIKPATSKEGNSETYVVCTKFKGPTVISPYLEKLREYYESGPKTAIFSKHDIPCAFIEKIIQCSEFFKFQQSLVIKNNIDTFKTYNSKVLKSVKQIQRLVADRYIKDYNLKKLESGEIVGNTVLRKAISINQSERSLQGSYNERCEKQHLAPLNQIEDYCNDINKIEIHVSSDKVIKYKFTKLPEDLQIRSGKAFHRIHNSKFCNKTVLRIQNGVDDILIKTNYKIQFPSIENINELKSNISSMSKHEVLIFQYTDTYDSHRIITKIYDMLQNLHVGTTLVLIGYSLLTHLNIELLYLISNAFNLLEITLCNNVGLKITLDHYNCNCEVLRFLSEIKTASSEAQKEGKAILGIISPLLLYEGCDLCYSTELNYWVIKTYIHYVLYTFKKK